MRRMIVAFIIIIVGASVAALRIRAVAQTADTAAEAQAIRELSRQWVATVATKAPQPP